MESKDVLLILVALVFFVAIGYLVYDYAMSVFPPHHDEPEESSEAKELYLHYLDISAVDEYEYVYEEDTAYIDKIITIKKTGNNEFVSFKTAFYEKQSYFRGKEKLLCLKYNEQEMCTNETNSADFSNDLFIMSTYLFDKHSLEVEKEKAEFLIEHGAMEFSDTIEESVVNGYPCKKFSYTKDLGKLSIEELGELGLNPSSPEVKYYQDQEFELCVNEEGILYSIKMNIKLNDEEITTDRKLIDFNTEVEEIELPKDFADITEFIALYKGQKDTESTLLECYAQENPTPCIRGEALYLSNEAICDLIEGEKRDNCLVILSSKKKDESICEKITDSGIKDDCYFEVAFTKNDPELCDLIENEVQKNSCIDNLTGN